MPRPDCAALHPGYACRRSCRRSWRLRSNSRKWHKRNAFSPRKTRQHLIGECLEVAGLLVRRPTRLVDVELVDKKYLWVRRRAIGQEQLDSGFRHRWPDQRLKARREPFFFAGI